MGLNLFAIRVVKLAAFLRAITRGELFKIIFTSVDRWLLIFFVTLVGIFTLRTGKFNTYQFGAAVDACLAYFSFRALITNFAGLGIDYIDVLKTDVEGPEKTLFKHLAGWIDRVGVIIAELHDHIQDWSGDAFFTATRNFLGGPIGVRRDQGRQQVRGYADSVVSKERIRTTAVTKMTVIGSSVQPS